MSIFFLFSLSYSKITETIFENISNEWLQLTEANLTNPLYKALIIISEGFIFILGMQGFGQHQSVIRYLLRIWNISLVSLGWKIFSRIIL